MIKLRPYQSTAAKAILHSVKQGLGLTFTVMMSRQAGKNELSAWLETVLLTRALSAGGTGIKAAPTLRPQALISLERLRARLTDAGLAPFVRIDNNVLHLGRARWRFLSAAPTANIVGLTADLLLEIDEAQDVDPDKYNRDLRPMASTTNTTTVLYGTAWTDTTLLEIAKQTNLEQEKRDGIQRHFETPWTEVANHNPAYRRFVEQEKARLGADHPLFTTQYDLQVLPGAGRLFTPAQLAQLHGQHPRELRPDPTHTYVAGLDIAGEDPEGQRLRGRDSTVLTIARVTTPDRRTPPTTEIVNAYATTGAAHYDLYAQIADLLKRVWNVRAVAIDATAIGEAAALYLANHLGKHRVIPLRFTEASKSMLGYQLLTAASSGRLAIWADDNSPEHRELWEQLRLCRAVYKPNRHLAFHVDPADGHDDYVVSLALAVHAALHASPTVAHGRIR